jgi:3-oxoacyl-[acyl-carrier protein] reductase
MDLGLKNKIALVTAASRGLGRAVAEELAAEGASLIICSRKADAIERVAVEDQTGPPGLRSWGVAADVANPDDVARLVQAGIERFGRIDILVTNAAGLPRDSLRVSRSSNGKQRRASCFTAQSSWLVTRCRE